MKTVIVVLGPPRSGTSAISHILHKFGVDFGNPDRFVDPEINPHNPIFFELVSLNRLNDEIFAHFDKNWSDFDWLPDHEDFDELCKSKFEAKILNFIKNEFSKSNIIGLKDPRFCYTAPLWHSVLTNAGLKVSYLLTKRSPESIYFSNKSINKLSSATNFRLVAQSILLSDNFLKQKSHMTVDYDALQEDPKNSINSICNYFNLNPDHLNNAYDIVNANLQHQKPDQSTSGFYYFLDVASKVSIPPRALNHYREIYLTASHEKDNKIADLTLIIEELKHQIAALNRTVLNREALICQLEQTLADKAALPKDTAEELHSDATRTRKAF